jgi:hypothetical protein
MAITMKAIEKKIIRFTIKGTSPLIQHQWSEKAKREMREKHAGKKTKTREARDPEAEFQAACYLNDNDEYGIPLMAFKNSLITAAHKDIGIEKTLVRKALFIKSDDSGLIEKIDCSEPVMREDMVRVGAGSADMRYRPEFREWAATITCEIDGQLLTIDDVINLVNRAGFGVGIGEWRPEKNGEYGRFEVDPSNPVEEVLN